MKTAGVIRTHDVVYVSAVTGSKISAMQRHGYIGRLIKIGKTRRELGATRNTCLNTENECTFTWLQDPVSLAHPTNTNLKLTDTIVRKHVVANCANCKQLPADIAKIIGVDRQGYTEIVEFPLGYSNKQVCDSVNKVMKYLHTKAPDTVYVPNTETEEHDKDVACANYIVPSGLTADVTTFQQLIEKDICGQKILLLRAFSSFFIGQLLAKGADVTLVIDSYNIAVDMPKNNPALHIYHIDFDGDENVKHWIEVMENRKFDITIANPPYRYGKDIILEALKHSDSVIALMPFSKYNGSKLYKKIQRCESVDSRWFKNADISDNTLCVTVLTNEYDNGYTSWSEFKAAYKTAEQYREFYILNQRLPRTVTNTTTKMDVPIDVSTTFMISPRVGDDGVHKDQDCYDYRFNVLENLPQEEWSVNTYKGKSSWNFTPYRLNSVKAKKNLSRFWYGNPLMNDLIRNSGESSSSYNVAMPRVNWELDLDWECITYDELLELVKQQLCELGISYDIN